MSLYVQHGYGKGKMISEAIEANLVKGIIISPKDEKPENTTNLIKGIPSNIEVLFDPQFQAFMIEGRNDGRLSEYPYYVQKISRLTLSDSENIIKFVKDCIDYQTNLGLSSVISPTVTITDFRDMYSQKALDFAIEASKHIGKDKLLIGLVVKESAFSARADVDEYLRTLTEFDKARGFYLLVERANSDLEQHFNEEVLVNIMYFIFVLSKRADFEVIVGYSDYVGLLYHAVGAHATACGWHNSLKLLSSKRFMPSQGGRPKLPRYSCSPLLTHLVFPQHMRAFDKKGMLNDILSETDYDERFTGDTELSATIQCLTHWQALGRIIDRIDSIEGTKERLEFVSDRIFGAKSILNSFRTKIADVSTILPIDFSYLDRWQESIRKLNDLLSKGGQI
jgi:hypothetical protein